MSVKLQDIQKNLKMYITTGLTNSFFEQTFRPCVNMDDITQPLDAYREGYSARLTEALGETYEACWRVLGDEEFFKACRAYIKENPSKHYNLSFYGDTFPEFLHKNSWGKDFSFLLDLANFEKLFKNLFHSAQHKVFTIDVGSLSRCDDFRLKLAPTVKFFKSSFSVSEIWSKRRDEKELESSSVEGEEYLMLFKSNSRVYVHSLERESYTLLDSLQDYTFCELVGVFASKDLDLQVETVSECFSLLSKNGLIDSIVKVVA